MLDSGYLPEGESWVKLWGELPQLVQTQVIDLAYWLSLYTCSHPTILSIRVQLPVL
jgi:hypothetical protein